MKRLKSGKSWSVRVTLPKGEGRTYPTNKSLTVIATSLDEAQKATFSIYPDAVIYGIQHRGEGEVIIADEVYDEDPK